MIPKTDAMTVPYLWGHLGKYKDNKKEIQLELLMSSTKLTSDSKFTRNNKTQPSSVPSERSKTINTAPQMSILSCIRTVWAQVSHVGLGTASCTLLEQRSHLSYGKPPLYLYLYTYIFLYLTYDGTWHNTKVLQMKCNMNHWSDLVPSLLLLHFTNNNKT